MSGRAFPRRTRRRPRVRATSCLESRNWQGRRVSQADPLTARDPWVARASADPRSGIQRLVSYLVRSTPSGNVRVSTRFRFTQLSRVALTRHLAGVFANVAQIRVVDCSALIAFPQGTLRLPPHLPQVQEWREA